MKWLDDMDPMSEMLFWLVVVAACAGLAAAL
jgi:hypothetical protein